MNKKVGLLEIKFRNHVSAWVLDEKFSGSNVQGATLSFKNVVSVDGIFGTVGKSTKE